MASTSFTRELGTKQGRIKPSGSTPAAGDYVFCLGFDDAQHFEELDIGDHIEVSQAATFNGATRLLRVNVTVRAPSAPMPSGTAWKLSLKLDGTEKAAQFIVPGRATRQRKLAINVSKVAAGAHTVAVRLELVAA